MCSLFLLRHGKKGTYFFPIMIRDVTFGCLCHQALQDGYLPVWRYYLKASRSVRAVAFLPGQSFQSPLCGMYALLDPSSSTWSWCCEGKPYLRLLGCLRAAGLCKSEITEGQLLFLGSKLWIPRCLKSPVVITETSVLQKQTTWRWCRWGTWGRKQSKCRPSYGLIHWFWTSSKLNIYHF